jgi:hypothetical protein
MSVAVGATGGEVGCGTNGFEAGVCAWAIRGTRQVARLSDTIAAANNRWELSIDMVLLSLGIGPH